MKGKWIVVVGLITVGYLGWRHHRTAGLDQVAARKLEDPALLLDRLWVDSTRKKPVDYVHALLVLQRLPVGVFQKGSEYRLLLERFEYLREGSNLRLRFPQSSRNERLSYQIRRCHDRPPFDLCLELSRNPWDGPVRYYGKRDSKTSQLSDWLSGSVAERADQ